MKFIKINGTWNAEPNAPMPQIEIAGPNLKLSFLLNTFIYKEFAEDDLGILEFSNCRQYRLGSPNDEGFYEHNECRYSQYGVAWGEFYRIQDSDWRVNFPQPVYVDTTINMDKLNHYLFYLKDETFECISEEYIFRVEKRTPQY